MIARAAHRFQPYGEVLAVTEVDVPVSCSYDLEVASARYLQGLDDGTIPLLMLFSGENTGKLVLQVANA